eukprot:3735475-Alexandrium_andersonii.AAC.1
MAHTAQDTARKQPRHDTRQCMLEGKRLRRPKPSIQGRPRNSRTLGPGPPDLSRRRIRTRRRARP